MNDSVSRADLSKQDIKFLKDLAAKRKAVMKEAVRNDTPPRPKLLTWIIHLTFKRGLPEGWGK